jgi:hypothetical protein
MMVSLLASAQEHGEIECKEIFAAIKSAQTAELSPYLANSVECDMFGKSNVYSKAQAIQVMKDFFAQNKPKQFVLNHQGGQNTIRFFVGTYKTMIGKKYRITCHIKKETGKDDVLTRIKIEDCIDK